MYNVCFEIIDPEKKIDLTDFKKSVKNNNWKIKIKINGQLTSIEECIEIIEKFELQLEQLSLKTIICKQCGNCCSHGPEISLAEINYFKNKFPEYKEYYNLLKSVVPCALGGIKKHKCLLPKEARPLQWRLLYCEADIIGFESFYNFIGNYLNWSKI